MSENTETPDFETALKTLETLVEQMERGELTLEQSLQCFEQGIRLTRECQTALADAEQRVEILLEKTPGGDTRPLDEGMDDPASTDV